MKKIKFYAIGLAIVLIGFVSCQNEMLLNPKNLTEFQYDVKSKIDYSGIKTESKGFKGINGSDQILVFQDMRTFNVTLAELERQTKELDNAFVEYYSELEEEALNDKEKEIGFSEEQPLFVFENTLGFNSLHKKIAIEEEQWLNQEELDFENDPNNHFVMEDEVRTILNADGEVQIGNSIYKLTEEGYFEIIDGDLKTLSVLDGGNSNNLNLPKNVIFVGDDSNCNECKTSDCNSNKRNSNYEGSDKYRIKWVVSHWTYPWTRRVAAKVDNFKKKNNHWEKYRTNCWARVYGDISGADGECNTYVTFNTENGVYAYANAKHVEHKITVLTKTRPNWVKAQFYGGGISYSKSLTW
ncbi:MAG TPA: hypothetical protein PKK38_05720 [Bacteroidales bacterium]|jgi:hypothetical protein|nr:hypothetical protein [Bacteroidales bacterium]